MNIRFALVLISVISRIDGQTETEVERIIVRAQTLPDVSSAAELPCDSMLPGEPAATLIDRAGGNQEPWEIMQRAASSLFGQGLMSGIAEIFLEITRATCDKSGWQNSEHTMANPIHPDVRIGHVHLKVADLNRAIHFYQDVLGFELTQRYGKQAAFLSAGGYHHHIGLNTWESEGGSPPPACSTGLYHLAIAYPTRAELADALRRVLRAGIRLEGASNHGVSEAIYLRDPDDNGVELYWDRPRERWPRTATGELAMITEPLDLDQLLREPA